MLHLKWFIYIFCQRPTVDIRGAEAGIQQTSNLKEISQFR